MRNYRYLLYQMHHFFSKSLIIISNSTFFILNNCKSLDGENLSKDAFMLLRTLTGDIYNSLVSSEVPVN